MTIYKWGQGTGSLAPSREKPSSDEEGGTAQAVTEGYNATGQGFTGNNMFAYCGNNPIIRIDSNGFCYGYPNNPNLDSAFSGARLGIMCGAYGYHVRHPKENNDGVWKDVVDAVYSNIDASIGFGYGLYGEVTIAEYIGIGFGGYGNLAEFRLEDGEFAVVQSIFGGLQISLGPWDVAQDANDSETRDYFGDNSSAWVEDDYNQNWNIFSCAGYFFGGASVYVGFDVNSFLEDIDNIFFN